MMAQEAWIEGPWELAPDVNRYGVQDDGAPILGTVMAGGTWHIAVLPSDLAESEANARLITAAPDLYGALALFDGVMQERALQSEPDEFAFSSWLQFSFLPQARAALAKARGQ